MSLVLRFTIREHDEVDHAEFRKSINAVRNNFPGVLDSLQLNSFEKRAALRTLGLPRISGVSLSEIPMVRIPDAAVHALERFMFKLGCALHYKHVGKCLPAEGRITHQFRTNAMLYNHPLPDEVLHMVPAFAILERCKQTLDDQFTYRFGASIELEAAIFVCLFRHSFSMVVITIGKPEILKGHAHDEFLVKEIEVSNYLKMN